MSLDILLRQDSGNVTTLTMNTPKSLNALSDDMLAALQNAFDDIAQNPKIRAVILRGAGKAFCAGHNLKEMTAARSGADGGKAYFADLFARCAKLMLTIQSLPQPVIAQAHGIATAAGCQLVATCDMAVAADDTRFGVNGVNIGLFCSTPMVALSRNVPRKQAFEMLTTGKFIDAEQAEKIGLINRAVAYDDLDAATMELAQTVAAKLGSVVKIGKQAFYNQAQMPVDAAYDYAADVMVQNMMYQETAEGIAAFIEKRAPKWAQ
ncbi:enoyl-CoA hydratase [Amylibacter kogurei]|uniref:Enoyl-CoA hydratase domain-containing protein 3, mitochondrial n=1 Tax=Paramylibacter kogurei TaxID=1889778 RepID=A0A2G5K7K2_9RHOB|nr:enoyl-CoA hydratase [Amylibacter kogurei]PIB24840.1 enoyl-CoA hydratase [Amylibacter kogurei]